MIFKPNVKYQHNPFGDTMVKSYEGGGGTIGDSELKFHTVVNFHKLFFKIEKLRWNVIIIIGDVTLKKIRPHLRVNQKYYY